MKSDMAAQVEKSHLDFALHKLCVLPEAISLLHYDPVYIRGVFEIKHIALSITDMLLLFSTMCVG